MTTAVTVFPKVRVAIVALGNATSGEVDLQGSMLTGIYTPSALTNSTISILAATRSGGTFARINNESSQPVSIAVATNNSRAIGLDTWALSVAPWRFVKIQTGTPTSPATEAAARMFYLVTK
jgi:hypothetical protein